MLRAAIEFFQFFAAQRLLASKQMCDQSNLGKVLNRLHLHVCVMEVGPVRDYAVIRHQQGVILRDQWRQGVGELGCARRAVLGQRYRTQPNYHLANQRLVQGHPSGGKTGGGGRMRMHHPVDVGPQPVN